MHPSPAQMERTMEVEAVPAPRALNKPVPTAPPPPVRQWSCAVVARLLTGLMQRPVTSEEITRRTVGLGLSRHPGHELCLKAMARLFLSAYQLPAHIEEGTLALLESHLAADRRTWIVLDENAYQVVGLSQEPLGAKRVAVRPVGDRFVLEKHLAVDEFVATWKEAGSLLAAVV